MGPLCFAHPEGVKIYLEFLDNFCVNSVLMLKTDNLNVIVSQRATQAYVGTVYNTTTQEFCGEKDSCLEIGKELTSSFYGNVW